MAAAPTGQRGMAVPLMKIANDIWWLAPPGRFKTRTRAVTSGYYRTSSPVTALPMIMRWISLVPSIIMKLVEVRAVSAGRRPMQRPHVSTNSAPRLRPANFCPSRTADDRAGLREEFRADCCGHRGRGHHHCHRTASGT